jgi:hypothetical protein
VTQPTRLPSVDYSQGGGEKKEHSFKCTVNYCCKRRIMADFALRGVKESSSTTASATCTSVARPKSFMTVFALLNFATKEGTVYKLAFTFEKQTLLSSINTCRVFVTSLANKSTLTVSSNTIGSLGSTGSN